MTPIESNLVIEQGEDYSITFDLNVGANTANLTGYSVTAMMRKSSTSSVSYAFDTNILPLIGAVNLTLSANTTLYIPEGRYMYDCIAVDPNNTHIKIIKGIASILPSATRW